MGGPDVQIMCQENQECGTVFYYFYFYPQNHLRFIFFKYGIRIYISYSSLERLLDSVKTSKILIFLTCSNYEHDNTSRTTDCTTNETHCISNDISANDISSHDWYDVFIYFHSIYNQPVYCLACENSSAFCLLV